MSEIVVSKFGGTSVADFDAMNRSADIVRFQFGFFLCFRFGLRYVYKQILTFKFGFSHFQSV